MNLNTQMRVLPLALFLFGSFWLGVESISNTFSPIWVISQPIWMIPNLSGPQAPWELRALKILCCNMVTYILSKLVGGVAVRTSAFAFAFRTVGRFPGIGQGGERNGTVKSNESP